MGKEKKKQARVLGLIVALIVVLFGGLLFVGAVSGWFDDDKVILDNEYVNFEYDDEQSFYEELDAGKYDELVRLKKSFIVFVDQDGCTTADKLREYIIEYEKEVKIAVYRMMFSEVKESSLHEFVKYYPSVALVDRGVVRWYLRADSDEDDDFYNNYEVFKGWMNQHL